MSKRDKKLHQAKYFVGACPARDKALSRAGHAPTTLLGSGLSGLGSYQLHFKEGNNFVGARFTSKRFLCPAGIWMEPVFSSGSWCGIQFA